MCGRRHCACESRDLHFPPAPARDSWPDLESQGPSSHWGLVELISKRCSSPAFLIHSFIHCTTLVPLNTGPEIENCATWGGQQDPEKNIIVSHLDSPSGTLRNQDKHQNTQA